ncbi:hypothetical protein [uncultured Halomonas sp.]|uniref:hypothetical protein n=1 Tax=uncultured Halomonas sp. TaxID=173971 RepID=UPI00260464F8|nr:hypothetical protein [uncultured Halomonas sp.]
MTGRRIESETEVGFEEYELEVGTYDVRMSTGIIATAGPSDLGSFLDQPLYSSHMQLNIAAKIVFPFQQSDMECGVYFHSVGVDDEWSRLRVSDVQRRGENGKPNYIERGAEWVPELDSPRSIGYFDIEPEGGAFVNVYLPFYLVQEFRTALSFGHAKRIFVGVQNTGLDRLIQHIIYSTPGLYEV